MIRTLIRAMEFCCYSFRVFFHSVQFLDYIFTRFYFFHKRYAIYDTYKLNLVTNTDTGIELYISGAHQYNQRKNAEIKNFFFNKINFWIIYFLITQHFSLTYSLIHSDVWCIFIAWYSAEQSLFFCFCIDALT